MSYIVTAPLIGANGSDGKIKYLYQGATVPADVSTDDVKRFLADGLVVRVGGSDPDEPTAAEKRAAAAKAKADKEAAEKAAAEAAAKAKA